MIECKELSIRYGKHWVLKRISCQIQPGSFVVLLGANGAGKTTLLKGLAGLLPITKGELSFFKERFAPADPMVKQRLGLLTHDTFLYPQLSVYENLIFWGELYHLSARTERVNLLMEQFGLGTLSHRPIEQLSQGFKRRAALVRAMLHDPDILLLDEPFSHLDTAQQQFLAEQLRAYHATGKTIVMATHDLERGYQLASQVMILHNHHLIFSEEKVEIDFARLKRRYLEIWSNANTSSGN